MKEHAYAFPPPIADAMIRALLEGRKIQIRIPCKHQPSDHHWKYFSDYRLITNVLPCMDLKRGGETMFVTWTHRHGDSYDVDNVRPFSPLGAQGDRVWFREKWRTGNTLDSKSPKQIAEAAAEVGYDPGCPILYVADNHHAKWCDDDIRDFGEWGKVRSSVHMPRWASRLSREIVSVRVERVQETTLKDVVKLGLATSVYDFHPVQNGILAFQDHWNLAHGPGAFEKNPLVWVYEVK